MPAVILLTPVQLEAVQWAFGAMADFWGAGPGESPDPDAEVIRESEDLSEMPEGAVMPHLEGNTLHLSAWNEINDDLAFRVGEMQLSILSDMNSDGEITDRQAARRGSILTALAQDILAKGG